MRGRLTLQAESCRICVGSRQQTGGVTNNPPVAGATGWGPERTGPVQNILRVEPSRMG